MRSTTLHLSGFSAALALLLLALVALALSRPSSAEAHPLGNFTVNRYSRIELYSDAIRIRYVLDMAEIPAFQEMEAIDSDGDGQPSPQENEAYLSLKSAEIVDNLRLTLNGSPANLAILTREISYPEGQAGLSTLRLGLMLEALPAGSQASVDYRDDNYADRIGWKEIVVRTGEGVDLANSTASSEDISEELSAYPSDLLATPLDMTFATLTYSPGRGAAAPAIASSTVVLAPARAPARLGGGFASLIDSDNLTLPVILLSLLLALGFGAIHALEPGHGKTFVAAYFVGVKGTARQAMSLGLVIAATHTIGVLLIGLITLFASRFILPERLYPWLSLASGLMILALGVRLIADRSRNWRLRRKFFAVVSRRSQREEEHDHDHGHNHGHSHSHEPAADGVPPWRSLLALGLADGLTPSPSALVVLLAAVSLDRIGLGILLIMAFSVGLAAVLTLVCLGLIYARRFLDWMASRQGAADGNSHLGWIALQLGAEDGLFRIAPVGGAVALMAVGFLLTIRAISQGPLFS